MKALCSLESYPYFGNDPTMDGTPDIARIGALLGDNARAMMLSALMHGKALTASELARQAGVTAQTATSHLSKLETGGLLQLRRQGRHTYFALASGDVAALPETLMGLTSVHNQAQPFTGPRDAEMRKARTTTWLAARAFSSMTACLPGAIWF